MSGNSNNFSLKKKRNNPKGLVGEGGQPQILFFSATSSQDMSRGRPIGIRLGQVGSSGVRWGQVGSRVTNRGQVRSG